MRSHRHLNCDHHRHRHHHHHHQLKRWYVSTVTHPALFHCPLSHMPRYLGVRAKIEKGRRMWAAGAYGAELGRAPSEKKAAEIVRKMGQVASIKYLVIPSAVLRPRSVARYEGITYRKPGRRSLGGLVGGQ